MQSSRLEPPCVPQIEVPVLEMPNKELSRRFTIEFFRLLQSEPRTWPLQWPEIRPAPVLIKEGKLEKYGGGVREKLRN